VSYLDYIDDTAWQRLVGVLLNFDGAEILSWHSEEIFTGIGAGTRLYRVAGTATAGSRRPAVTQSGLVAVTSRVLEATRSERRDHSGGSGTFSGLVEQADKQDQQTERTTS
jgi:hypothetical protein